MRRAHLFIGILAAVAMLPQLASAVGPTQVGVKQRAAIEGGAAPPERVSVLVHLAPRTDRTPIRQFAASQGGRIQYEYKLLHNVLNLRGIPEPALSALSQIPGVVRVEADGEVHAHINDSTPLIGGLQSQIASAGLSADGMGVRVCIVDTGIDSDHIMYADRIDTPAGRDFVNDDNDPEDDAGHGSHVAGIALGGTGVTVNFGCVGSESLQGVAPESTLIGVKVLSSSGSGSFSDVIAGIDHCADQSASGGRADVINLSLGGGSFSGTCDNDTVAAAANAAVSAGVVVVASSGNDGASGSMGTPACGSQVIAVGATYDDDYPSCEFPSQNSFTFCTKVNRIGFCTGSCTDSSPYTDDIACFSNQSPALDVVAPGCISFSADHERSPNGIVGFCGTSMAAPHVSGLAALLLSADPSLTPDAVRQNLRDAAIDLGSYGFDTTYGYGRIDVLQSLSLLGPGCSVDSDCDDSDLCTTDQCSGGSCTNTPLNCDDGSACTTDVCSAGACSNTPIDCNDGDACTDDSCDVATGCVNDPLDCSDGSLCTSDLCSGGVCINDPLNCDDGDSCTIDGCDEGLGCTNEPSDDPVCTGPRCGDGVCDGNGEDCFSCPTDCRCAGGGGCRACCGDGICAGPGERAGNCPVDCGG